MEERNMKPRFSLMTNKPKKTFMQEFKDNYVKKVDPKKKDTKVRVIGRITLPLSENMK